LSTETEKIQNHESRIPGYPLAVCLMSAKCARKTRMHLPWTRTWDCSLSLTECEALRPVLWHRRSLPRCSLNCSAAKPTR
jgi:hypothetical protein